MVFVVCKIICNQWQIGSGIAMTTNFNSDSIWNCRKKVNRYNLLANAAYFLFCLQVLFDKIVELGRDLALQIVAGSKDVLAIAFLTGVFTVVMGVVLGLVSGLVGGWVDRVLQLVTNLFLTVPSFPILLVLSTMIVIKDNITFALILSVWSWAGLCRAVRAQIISLKEREFIQICNVMGMKKSRIIVSELLPNIASYIAVNFIQIMRGAITGSVGIMMLGLAALDSTNWGTMLYLIFQMGYLTNDKAIFYVLSPILCIVLFQFGVVMLANGVDELLNPRLRKN